ncbi:hypothetical protein K3495_g4154 [Podosphaera aphanis]|nr:hypothetical protein K3495_g4154 [Podosphaera aphanis]
MDGYSSAFLVHNIPLVYVSGLGSAPQETTIVKRGIRISSDVPQVESEAADILLRYFEESDASHLPWNSREFANRNKLRVKTIARDFTIPLRTATPNQSSQNLVQTSKIVFHSALSPLSPESTLFPDGLICSEWIGKHQELVPSAIISFYTLTSDSNFSGLQDDQLKLDINNLKNTLTKSGYKTQLIIVLLGEESVPESFIEKRLANIRRDTGLDARTCLFFLPSRKSSDELKEFYKNLISLAYPVCIEYYRDLSKHSRRKKNRGVIPRPTAPPTSGTSQILSCQGWNFRYDFKLGVFAEFRQEMDLALRSYESAYEALMGPDILEAIASWSPRWNEARCLADVLAFRMIRCLLWNKKYTLAVHRWLSHKEKIKDFVDRRGKGSATYGWKAWEARWATVMAETIKKVSIPEFYENTIYLPLEKSITLSKLQPWEYLHHPGYWFRVASNHLIARRNLALQIPEEDRLNPSSISGSPTAKSSIYDTYMCPPPHEESPLPGHQGVDHSTLIIESLKKAIFEFEKRKQVRLVQELKLLSAQEYTNKNFHDEALKILLSLRQDMSYRKECWWNAVEEVLWAIRKVAVLVGDASSILAVDWELMNKDFTYHLNWPYDLAASLRGLNLKTKPLIELRSSDLHSFLNSSFNFDIQKCKVGESFSSQFAVSSSAVLSAASVTISEICICFEGSMKTIILKHQNTPEKSPYNSSLISIIKLKLLETLNNDCVTLTGSSCLTFMPGHTTIFEFHNFLTEPGKVRAISAKFSISLDLFDLNYIQDLRSNNPEYEWWNGKSRRKKLVRGDSSSITILPKPPKMEMHLGIRHDQYFIDEQIILRLIVTNEEDFDSLVNLEVELLGEHTPRIVVEVDPKSDSSDNMTKTELDQEIELSGTHIGRIAKGKSTAVKIIIPPLKVPAKYELSMKATYHLFSDTKTPLHQTMSTELELVNPFKVECVFSPRVHPDPWPSLFVHQEGNLDTDHEDFKAQGISQKWCLTAHLTSIATSDVRVTKIEIEIFSHNDRIHCLHENLIKIPESGLRLTSKVVEELQFDISAQKYTLDDRGTANLDMFLVISWHRDSPKSMINLTTIPIPRLVTFSSEPRVLAMVSYPSNPPSMIQFDVLIENPSSHFLSFALSMESNENIAFSGMKQSILQLLPLSRKKIRYQILPIVRGEWIGPIQCVIQDRYFQKVLRITPTEGMKCDKEGILIWSPPVEN